MIAFSGPAGPERLPRGAVYIGTLAHLVAWTQQLHAELAASGIKVHVVCPGVPADVVTASLRGLELGEVVCAPGVERADLLRTVFDADLAAFGAQRPELANRYRSDPAADQ